MLHARTSDLVQKLQVARRELVLEAAIERLDRFHLLILDDITYVSKDQAETSVLFELISANTPLDPPHIPRLDAELVKHPYNTSLHRRFASLECYATVRPTFV